MNFSTIKKASQSPWFILLAAVIGILCGWQFQNEALLSTAQGASDVFLRILKLVSLPMISLSVLSTIINMGADGSKTIGLRVLRYTILTTILAAIVGIGLFSVITEPHIQTISSAIHADGVLDGVKSTGLGAVFMQMIPSNLIQPFVEHNVMGVMVITLLMALACLAIPEKPRSVLRDFFNAFYEMIMQLTRWVILLMPIAIWAFSTLFAFEISSGKSVIPGIDYYLITIVSANLIQALIIMPIFLIIMKVGPIKLFKGMLPALSFAFFSKSSTATIPIALESAKKIGIDKKISKFCFPLCTTINMNGCAAFIAITVMFVSQNYGIQFSFIEKITWVFVATLAALGNAGVPMGCFFLSTALLTAMGTPITLMGLILPFYALIDMLETSINVWSDSCITAVIDKQHKMGEI